MGWQKETPCEIWTDTCFNTGLTRPLRWPNCPELPCGQDVKMKCDNVTMAPISESKISLTILASQRCPHLIISAQNLIWNYWKQFILLCFINRLVSNQENVFSIKTYLTTRQVYSASEVHNCMKIDWRSCGSRCRLKLVHFAWTMAAIIGGPAIREMSLRLTQSTQNKSLIIPLTRSTWFENKSLKTTTEKNWR